MLHVPWANAGTQGGNLSLPLLSILCGGFQQLDTVETNSTASFIRAF